MAERGEGSNARDTGLISAKAPPANTRILLSIVLLICITDCCKQAQSFCEIWIDSHHCDQHLYLESLCHHGNRRGLQARDRENNGGTQ